MVWETSLWIHPRIENQATSSDSADRSPLDSAASTHAAERVRRRSQPSENGLIIACRDSPISNNQVEGPAVYVDDL